MAFVRFFDVFLALYCAVHLAFVFSIFGPGGKPANAFTKYGPAGDPQTAAITYFAKANFVFVLAILQRWVGVDFETGFTFAFAMYATWMITLQPKRTLPTMLMFVGAVGLVSEWFLLHDSVQSTEQDLATAL